MAPDLVVMHPQNVFITAILDGSPLAPCPLNQKNVRKKVRKNSPSGKFLPPHEMRVGSTPPPEIDNRSPSLSLLLIVKSPNLSTFFFQKVPTRGL